VSLDLEHDKQKNYEVQPQTNQTLKDVTGKKST
jgi:hypothetical protein